MKNFLLLISFFCFASCTSDAPKKTEKLEELFMETAKKKIDIQRDISEANKSKSNVPIEKMSFDEMTEKAEQLGIQLHDSLEWINLINREFDMPVYLSEGMPFFIRECGSSTYFKHIKKSYPNSYNIYTIVTEDFNYDEGSFFRTFKEIERISKQQLKFTEVKISNLGEPENVPILLDLKINDTPVALKLKLNNGHFDVHLLEVICRKAKEENINFSYWSHDGLSFTLFTGTDEFQQNIQNYLPTESCK